MKKKLIIITSLIIGLGLAIFILTLFFAQKKSEEILNKYNSVDSALKAQSSQILDNIPEKTYSKKNQSKVDLLKIEVDKLCDQIDDLKTKLMYLSEKGQSLSDFLLKDKNAVQLKTSVQTFKTLLIKEFQDLIKTRPENKINIDDIDEEGKKISWENYSFKNSPLAAIFSTLDKLKTEIKDAEKDVLQQLN